MKKVKFIFSYSELEAFVNIITHLSNSECTLFYKARNEEFFKIALRLAQRLLNKNKKYSVTFNMRECYFIYNTMTTLLGAQSVYENMIILKIITHIHKQTC